MFKKDRAEISPKYAANQYQENPAYRARCEAQARDVAKANPSDPFAYGRAIKNYANGIAYAGTEKGPAGFIGAEGYNVQWNNEERSYEFQGRTISYTVKVPANLKVPCAN